MRTGERGEALALARAVLDLPQADAHPYARAGAALLVAEFGNRADDRQVAEACAATLERALEPMSAPARRQLLAAQDLEAIENLHSLGELHGLRGSGGYGGAVDVVTFTASLERIALETDEEALVQVALDAAITLTGADRGYLLAYEHGRLNRVVTRAFDYEAEGEAVFSSSIVEHVLFNGEPVYLMDASADAEWSSARSVAALALKTVVCLPVAAGEDILGVLYMDREALEPVLSPTDMAMLQALATFTASGVFRARGRAEARRTRLTADYLGQLATGTAPEAATRVLLTAAIAASGADRALVLAQEASGRFVAVQAVNAAGAALETDQAVFSQGVAEKVYERQEALTVLDASSDTDWEARASVQALGLRSIWCVPLSGLERLLYLDTTELIQADPMETLRDLETLVGCALPLLGRAPA
jgi:GAF domain-containing protein